MRQDRTIVAQIRAQRTPFHVQPPYGVRSGFSPTRLAPTVVVAGRHVLGISGALPARHGSILFPFAKYNCILIRAMTLRRTPGLIAVGIAAIFLGALILFLPALLNLDRYRPQVIAYLQEKTGMQVEVGRLALTLPPVSIHMDDFGVRNPPPFPPGYVLKVARMDAQLDARALLHRQLVIKSLVLDNPIIHLASDPDGPWNFESPHAQGSRQRVPLGVIGKVEVKRGQLIASNLLPSDAPGPIFFEADNISGEFEQVNVDAVIDPSSHSMGGQGRVKADALSFGAVDAKNLSFKLQLWAKQVFLADVRAEVSGGSAVGALFFDLTGKRPAFRANAQFSGINVAHLLEPFGNGRGKMTGKMEGNLTLAGEIQHSRRPLAGIRGNGHVTVRNGEVPSLEFNAKLMRLVHFNDLGPAKENPSSFNFISTDLELANLRIFSTVIDIDGYGVDIDGSGSVNVDGSDELNYRGVAQITTKQGFFTNTFARFAGATLKDGKLSFPFRVAGTIEAPLFSKEKAH